ncbi:MAG: DUF1992 domain-containing protein [Chloroflexi bacterium]|nr:DUF1992 domain-containing protein [Chloroflexota bacterium]
MSLEQLIESRIRDAMVAGAFDNLPGAGRPLPDDAGERLAGENALGYKILKNGGLLPEWLMLARDIEALQGDLAELDRRHHDRVRWAIEDAAWEPHAGVIRGTRAQFETQARELRRRQDRFNLTAPGKRLERPGIWVEYHVARLDRRLREAGAPAWLTTSAPLPGEGL